MSSPQEEQGPTDAELRKKNTVRGIVTNLIGVALLGLIGWGLNILELAIVSLAVNWVVFLIHALPQDSEKFFDATGTLTYVTLVVWACVETGLLSTYQTRLRASVLVVMSLVWSIRLGSFLLGRICAAGKDSRFEELRATCLRWLSIWTIQAVWCFLVISPVLVVVKNTSCTTPVGVADYITWAAWLLAFIFEIVADNQKTAWRKDPQNKGRYINTGLWAYSRHPNYAGEIMMWVAIAICVSFGACLSLSQFLIWFSPLTTFILLKYVSGVPLLEKQGQERWGNEPGYQWYVKHTPEIFPALSRPPPYNPDDAGVTLA